MTDEQIELIMKHLEELEQEERDRKNFDKRVANTYEKQLLMRREHEFLVMN